MCGYATDQNMGESPLLLIFKFPFIELLFAQLTPSVRRGDLWSPSVGTENLNILPFKITVLSSKQAGDHRSPLR